MDNIVEISTAYVNKALKGLPPHNKCGILSQGLYSHLRHVHGIETEIVAFDVATSRFNGQKTSFDEEFDYVEHICLKIGRKILDPTAGQFNDSKGNPMPLVYYGSRPIWYETPK